MSSSLTPYKFLQEQANSFNEGRTDSVVATVVANDVEGRDDVGERTKTGNWDYQTRWQFKFYLDGPKRSERLFTIDHKTYEMFPINIKIEWQTESTTVTSWEDFSKVISEILASAQTQTAIEEVKR